MDKNPDPSPPESETPPETTPEPTAETSTEITPETRAETTPEPTAETPTETTPETTSETTPQDWSKILSVSIAALAFLLSLSVTVWNVKVAQDKNTHDQRAELSSIAQRLIQLRIDRSSQPPNSISEEAYGEQMQLLTLAGHNLARDLAGNATPPELMTIADGLIDLEQYAAGKQLYRQANRAADNFSDKIAALRNLGVALVRYGDSQERDEGEKMFQAAMDIGDTYAEVMRNEEEKYFTYTLTQIARTDAWSSADCGKATEVVKGAILYAEKAATAPVGQRFLEFAKRWNTALAQCKDLKLPHECRPRMPPPPGMYEIPRGICEAYTIGVPSNPGFPGMGVPPNPGPPGMPLSGTR